MNPGLAFILGVAYGVAGTVVIAVLTLKGRLPRFNP